MDGTVANKLIHLLNPSFRYRWEIYADLLLSYLSKEKIWLDVGCGNNAHVELYRHKVKYAVGIDIVSPKCKLDKLIYIENITMTNIFLFAISSILYLMTKAKPIKIMRSNLRAVYRKNV